MPEPVEPVTDYAVTRGCLGTVAVRYYDPATDAHGTAVTCRGHREGESVRMVTAGDGEFRATAARWWLAGIDLPDGRPTVRSLIVDGTDRWVVESVRADEHHAAYSCETYLL